MRHRSIPDTLSWIFLLACVLALVWMLRRCCPPAAAWMDRALQILRQGRLVQAAGRLSGALSGGEDVVSAFHETWQAILGAS